MSVYFFFLPFCSVFCLLTFPLYSFVQSFLSVYFFFLPFCPVFCLLTFPSCCFVQSLLSLLGMGQAGEARLVVCAARTLSDLCRCLQSRVRYYQDPVVYTPKQGLHSCPSDVCLPMSQCLSVCTAYLSAFVPVSLSSCPFDVCLPMSRCLCLSSCPGACLPAYLPVSVQLSL